MEFLERKIVNIFGLVYQIKSNQIVYFRGENKLKIIQLKEGKTTCNELSPETNTVAFLWEAHLHNN